MSSPKKTLVVQTVLNQNAPFYASTITSLSGASVALVSNTLNQLESQGKITSRKEGKKNLYALTSATFGPTTLVTEPSCSVEEKFEFIRDVVRMVIKGTNPSALIVGRSGVGKTYLVRDELTRAGYEADVDYLFVSGHTSAFGLYKLLHDNRDSFIVFDDCDSAFKDMKSVNLLKSALDSYDVRRVSWFSEKTSEKEDIEPFFDFTGRIIFISNLYADKIDEAIRSRSFCMNLHMTNQEVTSHMKSLLKVIEPAVDMRIKEEVLAYLNSIAEDFSTYGLRTLMQAIRIRFGASANNDWKKMVKLVTANT